MPQLSFLGCGWLGTAFVKKYADTYDISAGVRTFEHANDLQQFKCTPYCLPKADSDFYQCDILIISLTPRHNYKETLAPVFKSLPKTTKVLLLSSTSVYRGLEGTISDTNLPKLCELSDMLRMENYVREHVVGCTILRLGGLMGDNRIAGRWKSPTKVLENTAVNYLHQEDAVSIIHHILRDNKNFLIINAVAPEHPLRSEIYKKNCMQFKEIDFQTAPHRYIASDILIHTLEYDFKYPNPLTFWG